MTGSKSHFQKYLVGLVLSCSALIAQASDLPPGPIAMIVPYAPGGSADVFARPIAEQMSRTLKQPVIVDLKPGAGGNIGAQYVAKNAKPNGQTFLFASVSLATAPSLSKINFDPLKDLTAVAGVATVPSLMLVSNNSPYKSVKELVAAIREKKIQATFGSSGINTGSHLVGELFKARTGIDMEHVPYKGSGAVYPDLIGGRITVLFDVMGSSVHQVKSGQVRALAITSKTRSKLLPDVPTLDELGYTGFEFGTWFGFFVPSKTPAATQKALESAILQSLTHESVKERLNAAGAVPLPGPGPEFQKWYEADVRLWQKMLAEGKLQRVE